MTQQESRSSTTVLIGTYSGDAGAAGVSRGLYAADWNGDTGALGPLRLVAELRHPSFLVAHPSRPIVYAASEVQEFDGQPTGAVAVLRFNGREAAVERSWPSGGTSPCHLVVDGRGEFLVAANYSSGTAGVFPLTDGLPTAPPQVLRLTGTGPDPKRQEGPHAHSAVFEPGSDRFHVQDLGSDRLWGFVLDRAAKTAQPLVPSAEALTPGCGPRHLTFHPTRPWAYVINELNSTVIALTLDRATGRMTPFQTVGTLPPGAPDSPPNSCADIHVSPDGAHLYGSNRGHDSLAVWRIAPDDGRLTSIQHVGSGGAHPRNFALSPDGCWLVCANMQTGTIASFRRDPHTGMLTPGSSSTAPMPVCLLFSSLGV